MRYYHSRNSETGDRGPETGNRSPSPVFRLPSLRDDRGQAYLEGIFLFALLAGVLLGCMLLGQWGTHLQNSQMGARLLTFDAGNNTLAQFGRAGDTATQTTSTLTWNSLVDTSVHASWLNTMFTLQNTSLAGRVKGTQRGRGPSSGTSLFNFVTASVSYFSTSASGTNSWAGTTSQAASTFDGIAYYVGYNQKTPQGLSSVPTIPATIPVLETIYKRVGAR